MGRKNFLFFGSDYGGERGSLLYSLIGTCKLNSVDPEGYLRYVLDVIADWPVNQVSELLPWRITLPAEYHIPVNTALGVRLLFMRYTFPKS